MIDPATATAIGNLISAAVLASLGLLRSAFRGPARGRSEQVSAFITDLVADPPTHLRTSISVAHGRNSGAVLSFLDSREGKAFARILTDLWLSDQVATHRVTLCSYAESGLRSHLPPQRARPTARRLVALMEQVLDSAGVIIGGDVLSARSANAYTDLVTTQLDLILAALRSRADNADVVADSHRFHQELCQVSSVIYGMIDPPHFAVAKQRTLVSVDDLYVVPALSDGAREVDPFSLITSDSERQSVTILGDPGAGKSSLVRLLAYKAAVIHGDLTPIVVTLRDYESLLAQDSGTSILQYIAAVSNADLSIKVSEATLEYISALGRLIVFFDGLDELANPKHRRDMSDRVLRFALRYPQVTVIVTSRRAGYHAAALPSQVFASWSIKPFDDRRVREYAYKWFATQSAEAGIQNVVRDSADRFVRESEHVAELRSNPLMLALMCIMYRRQHYIPESLPEIYEYCSELLFKTWDEYRDIAGLPRFTARVRTVLAAIAAWMFAEGLNESGVGESDLRARISAEMLSVKASTQESAEELADAFFDHCRERAWVFKDVGLSNEVERRFAFVHRSFLEYFTAINIRAQYRTPQELADYVLDQIRDETFDLVTFLTLQLAEEDADEVARAVLAEARTTTLPGTEFLVQACQYVEFHDDVVVALLRAILEDANVYAFSWRSLPLADAIALCYRFEADADAEPFVPGNELLEGFDEIGDRRKPLTGLVADARSKFARLLRTARGENRRALATFGSLLANELPHAVLAELDPISLLLLLDNVASEGAVKHARTDDERELATQSRVAVQRAAADLMSSALVRSHDLAGGLLSLGVMSPEMMVATLGHDALFARDFGQPFGNMSPLAHFIESIFGSRELQLAGFLGALLLDAAVRSTFPEPFFTVDEVDSMTALRSPLVHPEDVNDEAYVSYWHRVPPLAVVAAILLAEAVTPIEWIESEAWRENWRLMGEDCSSKPEPLVRPLFNGDAKIVG